MQQIQLILKNRHGVFIAADVLDFPYRLNRQALYVSASKLKSLGGTTSTTIKLDKNSKANALIFEGRTSIASLGKFYANSDFEAVIKENGTDIDRGTFRLTSVDSDSFNGTFFSRDAAAVAGLDKVRLKELGYVNGAPTWLADFEGALTFNQVNDLSNRQTDFVVPTVVYNNTPILDYLDFADNEIWGEFDGNDELVQRGLSFPRDFDVVQGFSSRLRMGLKFTHFPIAWYYRNVIEKVFEEVGLSVDSSLFYEDWFNAMVMTYEGSEFVYNWGLLGYAYAATENTTQTGVNNYDASIQTAVEDQSGIEVNTADLTTITAGTNAWIGDGQFVFKFANIITHDKQSSLIDRATLTNSFDRTGAYLVPADGTYRVSVASQIKTRREDFINLVSGSAYWIGTDLLNSFGSWDSNSLGVDVSDSWYGYDDHLLVVLRKDENGNYTPQTEQMLFQYMNGQNKDFTTNKSDVIAYFSPKRYILEQGGEAIPQEEIYGSPYTDFENAVTIGTGGSLTPYVSHDWQNISTSPFIVESTSEAEISIEVDLKKGEQIEIFWVSVDNIYGEALFDPDVNPVFSYALDENTGNTQTFGDQAVQAASNAAQAYYSIEPLCGTQQLDLATNLPDISGKDFIASFINDFQLHYEIKDKTAFFYPVNQFYSDDVYDITDRVDISAGWSATPIQTPKNWLVGFSNDTNDRLLDTPVLSGCTGVNSSDYGNLSISNESTNAQNTATSKSMFSATKFLRSPIALNPYGFGGIGAFAHSFNETTSPIASDVSFFKGLTVDTAATNIELSYDFPSIQSKDSYKVEKYGDWSLDFGYVPRLIYHLGTVNQYLANYGDEYQTIIDCPRPDINYVDLDKHWFRPTVSQFDGENSGLTGIAYPTLRFDGSDGRFGRYFENLIELYNQSEILTVKMAVTSKDWAQMKGSKVIRFMDQNYRLLSINDYDPVDGNNAIIKLLKIV